VNLPFDVRGTAFQQRVWQALQQTLPGQADGVLPGGQPVNPGTRARPIIAGSTKQSLK
jgi:hypothetical protein